MPAPKVAVLSLVAVVVATTSTTAAQESRDRLQSLREARQLALRADVLLPSAEELLALPEVSFGQDVKPLLSDNCFACHGPDEGSRQASVRLDLQAEATRRNRTGQAAIVPGDLSASRMAWRLFHPDPAMRMPPADSGKQLSDDQRRLLARWILDGAQYQGHWAYQPIHTETAPENPSDGLQIDEYVREILETNGLSPSPPADPQTLARRLSFDLVGLPPTASAIHGIVTEYLSDPTEAAYLQLVDGLLASSHYGERMALHWLDLVRYADTNGYHSDEPRSVSPYRDWVIRAFNNNMPFDRFTIEQLAGDLLDDPTTDQLIASTFNRLNQLTAEGGAQEKEYRAKYDADRVRAVSTVWMGATLGCAECHDHKFDPYLQRDFYSMAAFFADIEEHDVYTTGETWDPLLILPTQAQKDETLRIDDEIRQLEQAMAVQDLSADQSAWQRRVLRFLDGVQDNVPGWHPVTSTRWQSEGSVLVQQDDLSLLATGPKPPGDVYTVEFDLSRTQPLYAVRLEVLGHPSLKGGFSRAIRSSAELCELELELQSATGSWSPVPFHRAIADRTRGVENTIDGTTSSRWTLKAEKPIDDRVQAAFFLDKPLQLEAGAKMRVRLVHHGLNNRVAFGRFRFSVSGDPNQTLQADDQERRSLIPTDGVPETVLAALKTSEKERSSQQNRTIARFYRVIAPDLREPRARWVKLHERRLAIERASMSTLVTRSVTEPRATHILKRGNWLTPGERVAPAVPAFLPPLNPRGERPDRLDLAHWLVQGNNPLTARVVSNRFFKLLFGRGVSPVLDDLGSQGGAPSHPRLLDALARSYIDSGWDTKQLLRTLVLSDTYRQSSRSTQPLRERDPYNLLLARQQAQRLDAEFVRDNALAISGLLSTEIGGPSARPYQPDGYWRNANTFGGSSLVYEPSQGDQQYRRGLYTYWKRSFLHPSLLNFDAPSREECTAMREVSNTPLQALTLLNDPTYVEAARVLAARALREGGTTEADRMNWLFERALLRSVSKPELEVLVDLLAKQRRDYGADPEAAKALTSIGQAPLAEATHLPGNTELTELAAWTQVARTVLNLPEVITRF